MEAPAGSGVSTAARIADAPPQAPGAGRPRRILVVRLGAIGDCLRVLPSVAQLRRQYPEAEIGWVVGDLVAPLLEGHPSITRLHLVRRREMKAGPWSAWNELRRVGRELSGAGYDVAIDFHTRLKSGYLTRASGAPRRIGVDFRSGAEANFLFTNCHVRLEDPYENRVVRFSKLLAPLGFPAVIDRADLGLWIAPPIREEARSIHESAGRPEVAIFAGTSNARSDDRWPAERWAQVVRALGEQGVRSTVLWGPGEMESAAMIAAASPLCSLAPPTTLPGMMALLGMFRLYVGTNTAALHMAWMQDVPSVVLVGGRPWRTDRPLAPVPSTMLSAGGLEPYRKLHGAAARSAITGIEPAEVVAAALQLLE